MNEHLTNSADQITGDGRYHAGFVALVGRPNVGKSTLMNHLIGQKISIVTHKPQTTQQRINGILTTDQAQLVFIDTPGIHDAGGKLLNQSMNRAAQEALHDADVVVQMVVAGQWKPLDQQVQRQVAASGRPAILVVNKIDQIKHRRELLPWLDKHIDASQWHKVLLISARSGNGVEDLLEVITASLPEGPPLYPDEQISDRSQRFLVAELIREQLLRYLHKELPYGMHVQIERFDENSQPLGIDAVIWVERSSHKGMVIGKGGEMLKQIGKASRIQIKKMLMRPVHLSLWVSVRPGWQSDPKTLRDSGFIQ